MRLPLSWLREAIDIPEAIAAAEVAEILTRIGFEEEEVISLGSDLRGPIVVGRVIEFVEEPQSNGKTIRWCQVEVAPGDIKGIVCGARNFFEGDKVVVVQPGAVLPGGFEISARKTYGHVSNGMICSARELGMSDDHEGILRLATLGLDPDVGSDAIALLGLVDEVIDVSVLPDRGYAMSLRGIARELAAATGWAWRDPADISAPVTANARAVKATIEDPTAAERIVLRTVEGVNPAATSPVWMQRRLQMCGMRPISLAVDITNYVMLELGQPLHAFDAERLQGDIRVRRSGGGKLRTLDDVERELDPADIVIADDSGAIALAGTMGGASTEIHAGSTRIVIEAARFSAGDVARTSRTHKLSSEASRRFERGVDPELAPVASARAVSLLAEFGGGTEVGASEVDLRSDARVISLAPSFAASYVGADYTAAETQAALVAVGCEVTTAAGAEWQVKVPSWRPDLVGAPDLAEEVARLVGYDRIPSVLPIAPASAGLTDWQVSRRNVSAKLAAAGLVEVLCYPFMGQSELDDLGLAADDPRRNALALANPLNGEQPLMRTTLLPPLLATLRRNLGRGATNVAIFESGNVVLPDFNVSKAGRPNTAARPSDSEIEDLKASVPVQPRYVAAVMSGEVERGDNFELAQHWNWQSAIAVALQVGESLKVSLRTFNVESAPWHPGRCAALAVGDEVIGFAGELHPRVCERLGINPRTVAFELDLSALAALGGGVTTATALRNFPHAVVDVAFAVDEAVSVEDLRLELALAGGDLVEAVRLFDVYRGAQIPAGQKSLAFTVVLRAPDRTLTDSEVAPIREALVSRAAEKFGASLRA